MAETGECELLVLDEVLGLLDLGMISIQDLYRLIEHSGNYDTSLVMTGKYIPKAFAAYRCCIRDKAC